ncbi:MAG: hypothetical protein ACYC67_17480 [Prosthecobacter sp.]
MLTLEWAWWRRWAVLLSGLAGLQFLIQLLNGITGFLLVRALPREEYSVFTMTGTLLTMLLMLTDLGLTVGLINIGGRVWKERSQHAVLVADALKLRFVLFLICACFIAPIGGWLLIKAGATIGGAALLMALILLSAGIGASALIYATVARLHNRHRELQVAELYGAAARLVVSAAGLVAAATAVVAGVAVLMSQWVFGAKMRRMSLEILGPLPEANNEFRSELVGTLQILGPTAIFYGFQGQVATLLIAMFGTGGQVADLGALSRYNILFSISGVVMAQVVSPAAARATDGHHFWRILRLALLAYASFSGMIILGVAVFWRPALGLLGEQYLGLRSELILFMISSSLAGLNGLLWCFISARGWIQHVWVIIPVTIAFQAVLVRWLPLDTVASVLVFGAFSTLPGTMWFLWRGLTNFSRIHAFQ